LDIAGPNAAHYETDWQGRWHDRAMRDPWVMRDPEGDGWLMYFTARVQDVDESNAAGCIGFATSPDLFDWTLQPPVYTGSWGQLEVPQVFEHGRTWYCLFCMDPAHQSRALTASHGDLGRGNHYLVADNPRGPWRLPDGPALDTKSERYAARIVDADGLRILGFKDGELRGAFGGYIMNPAAVTRRDDGRLVLED
ncbi:MAG: levansucrase, partial [Pseudomonadota bacterium]